MTRLGVPTLGWLTATLLSLITFWVFWTLRYHGPESTLRQYHQAASDLNRTVGESLAVPNFGSERSWKLWVLTADLMDQGKTRYQIAHSSYEPNSAALIVQYETERGAKPALVWRLKRLEGTWRVDANETTRAFQRLLGPRIFDFGPVR